MLRQAQQPGKKRENRKREERKLEDRGKKLLPITYYLLPITFYLLPNIPQLL